MTAYLFPFSLTISLIAGMWLCERRSQDRENARRIYLFGAIAGLAGARFWYILQYGDWTVVGPFSAWGFAVGSTAGSILCSQWRKTSWYSYADAVAPSIACFGALTRVACFFIGCNFGTPTDLPWGVRYGPEAPAYQKQVLDGILDPSSAATLPVHPSQLYESGALLLAFVALLCLSRCACLLRGELLLGLALHYSVARFFLEFIRDDSGGRHFGSLTFAQGSCIGIAMLTICAIAIRRLCHVRPTSKKFTVTCESPNIVA